MNKNHTRWLQNGFLNISLVSIIAGITVVGNLIYATITHQNQASAPVPMAPVTQTVTADQTSTTNVLPPSTLGVSGSSTTTAANPATQVSVPFVPAAPKDCGTDASCLVASAQSCSPATGSLVSTFDIFGMNETVKNIYQITGPAANGTCTYNITLTSATIAPDTEFKKAAAIHKTNLANIQSDLASAQAALTKTIPTITSCSQPPAKVVQFITGMNQGNIAAQYMNANDLACTITPPTATTQ